MLFFIAFLRLSNFFKALDRRSENSKFYLLAAGCLAGWPAGRPAGGLTQTAQTATRQPSKADSPANPDSPENHGNPWETHGIPWKKFHGKSRKTMQIHRKSMEIHGRKSMEIHGKSVEIHGKLWKSIEIKGNPWKKIHGNLWKTMEQLLNQESISLCKQFYLEPIKDTKNIMISIQRWTIIYQIRIVSR